jgi:hypothetical protein
MFLVSHIFIIRNIYIFIFFRQSLLVVFAPPWTIEYKSASKDQPQPILISWGIDNCSLVWSVDFGLVGHRFKPRRRNWKRGLHFFVVFELWSWKMVNPRLEYMEFHTARSLSLHRSVLVIVNSCYQVSKKSTIVFFIIICTTVSLLLMIIKKST